MRERETTCRYAIREHQSCLAGSSARATIGWIPASQKVVSAREEEREGFLMLRQTTMTTEESLIFG
jgi:hypothetical protein